MLALVFSRFAGRERRFRPNRLDLLIKVIGFRILRGLSAEHGRQRDGSRKESCSADKISAGENRLLVHRFFSFWVDFTTVLSFREWCRLFARGESAAYGALQLGAGDPVIA